MRYPNTFGITFVLLIAAISTAGAHSLKELESQLGDREKYFQPIDKQASSFELKDASGRPVGLSDFQNKVVVLLFIYTNCPDVCPLHAERIAEIQEMINRTPMKEHVQFISVTTDPKNDTADVMHGYGPIHGLDPVNWVFLTGGPEKPEDTTRKLAERYGHKFTMIDYRYQLHGVVTHVIARDSRWRANFHGLKFEPTNLILFINALVNDVHDAREHGERSFWDRVRELF